ncbi:hypothetical protein FPV67DRAFT_266658 [Lyophyllum atratum]|nr:hypothetical protein FPV67DRAFT_266658 [Lyophyllum atratum]
MTILFALLSACLSIRTQFTPAKATSCLVAGTTITNKLAMFTLGRTSSSLFWRLGSITQCTQALLFPWKAEAWPHDQGTQPCQLQKPPPHINQRRETLCHVFSGPFVRTCSQIAVQLYPWQELSRSTE